MAFVEGVFTATGVSDALMPETGDRRGSGQFNLLLSGMVAGDVVVVERSFDGGTTFFGVQQFAGVDTNILGAEPEVGVLYRLNCTALAAAGPVSFRLSTSSSGAAGSVTPVNSVPVQAVFDRMSALSLQEEDAIRAMVDGLVSDGLYANVLEFYAPCLNATDFLTGFKVDTLIQSATPGTHVPGEGLDFLGGVQHVLEGRVFASFVNANGQGYSGGYSEFLAADGTGNSDFFGILQGANEVQFRWRGTDTTDYNHKYSNASLTPRVAANTRSNREVWTVGWDGTDILVSVVGGNLVKATHTFQAVPTTHPMQWHGQNIDGTPAAGNVNNMRFSAMFHLDTVQTSQGVADLRARVLQFLRDIGVSNVPAT